MKNENTVTADNEWLKRCEDFEQSVLKYKSVRFSRFVSPHDLAVFKLRFKPSPFIHILAFVPYQPHFAYWGFRAFPPGHFRLGFRAGDKTRNDRRYFC